MTEINRVKGSHKRVATDIKKQILERVKTSGKTVKEIAEEFGVATGTIYSWLSESAGGEITKKDLMDVQKENKQLKELLGEITLKMSVSQKKVW
jgi:transposase-like protein